MGEENAEGASVALTQEVLPELSPMWKGGDWCISGQLGSKGEAVCQGSGSRWGQACSKGDLCIRYIWGWKPGPSHLCCPEPELFSRCSGYLCLMGATIHSFIHSFSKDIAPLCDEQTDQVLSRTDKVPALWILMNRLRGWT